MVWHCQEQRTRQRGVCRKNDPRSFDAGCVMRESTDYTGFAGMEESCRWCATRDEMTRIRDRLVGAMSFTALV